MKSVANAHTKGEMSAAQFEWYQKSLEVWSKCDNGENGDTPLDILMPIAPRNVRIQKRTWTVYLLPNS